MIEKACKYFVFVNVPANIKPNHVYTTVRNPAECTVDAVAAAVSFKYGVHLVVVSLVAVDKRPWISTIRDLLNISDKLDDDICGVIFTMNLNP